MNEVKTYEKIVRKLIAILLSKISAYEEKEFSIEQPSDDQIKELIDFFKLMQAVEEMLKRIQEIKDSRRESGIDALEFRRKLEEQITQLVDEEAAGKVP